jgi:hypothetical protein
MSKSKSHAALLSLFALGLGACHTLSPEARHVAVTDRASEACHNLGHVKVDVTFSGLPSEAITALRNRAADKGGNTLVLVTDHAGIAYDCPIA